MEKKTVKKICVIIILLILLGVTFFLVDFNLVVRKNEPKMCININIYNNGITKEYLGIGYKIVRYNIGTINETYRIGFLDLLYDKNLDR